MSHGASTIAPNLLVLGGTTEATALCTVLAKRGHRATVSLAGRVARPAGTPLPQRIGGFGGVAGLVAHLRENAITHVIDATHPFAAQMSTNAVAACHEARVPLIALTRAPWTETTGDRWICVPDTESAVAALAGAPRRVFLAIGRMTLEAFAEAPQHHYILRLVDPPDQTLPVPDHHVVVARGPFTEDGDLALMREHRIEAVVSKNAGGPGAIAKISAARALGLPVVMIDRPILPNRQETHDPEEVLQWIDHAVTDLGV